MNFQELVDSYEMAAAVLSIEKTPEGHYGEIRIVRANSKYKQIMGSGYYDNCLYTEIVPKELNFEDFCYRRAVLKQHIHFYADTKAMEVWTDGTYLPLSAEYDTEKLCHFLFLFEFTKKPGADKMAEVSADAAAFVIKTCINLLGLRADSGADAKVSLAIGADWSDNGKYLRLYMHNADEAMYADKNKFYEEHPEVRRR